MVIKKDGSAGAAALLMEQCAEGVSAVLVRGLHYVFSLVFRYCEGREASQNS